MRRLGLPWRDALLITFVAAGLAASIVLFAATAPAFRGAPGGDEPRVTGFALMHEDLENTAAATNGSRPEMDVNSEEKSHDE